MTKTLNSRIPEGPVAEKWTNYKAHQRLVNPKNKLKLDVIVVGTGLAGASAAASLGEMGFNVLNFCIQDSPRRAHSIAAQGGINAAKNYQNDGDSVYRLFYDTIKGGDYRASEANVYRMAEVANLIIDQCVGQGVPFAREYGGLLANEILKQYDLSVADRITIVSAISNHDESTGGAVDPISAALIIGDKTDVRRSRVREKPKASFDIHDRVNYAVTDQTLKINTEAKIKSLSKGNKEKVQLVLVMCRKAQLYLLDEPIAGVDPAARDFILDTILNNYNEEGTVIISTHLIADIEKIMDEVIFIKEGNIVTYKSADDLREESGKSIDALFREIFHTDVYRGGDDVC